jgi:drug/metabolite transporter (DMT)-like permease
VSPELTAVLWGSTAALSWGVSAFPARSASAVEGPLRVAFYSQAAGAAALTALFLVQPWPSFDTTAEIRALLAASAAAAANAVATIALYHAYRVGMLAVVSPIAASYGAVTTLLSLLSGERLATRTIVGLAVTVAGVSLASVQRSSSTAHRLGPGVTAAFVASLGYGVAFWLLGIYVTPTLGAVIPVWVLRVVGPVALIAVAPFLKSSVWRPPRLAVWPAIIGLEALNLLAFLAMTVGLRTGAVSIVTVVGSMFSAVTVLLACIVLRERLEWFQWLGIGLTLAGVAMF